MAMIVIPRRVPWRRQPTPGVTVRPGLGIIAAWPMGEAAGPVLYDAAHRRNNATLNGAPAFTATDKGILLSFNGSSDSAQIAYNSIFDISQITVGAIIGTSSSGSIRQILSKDNTTLPGRSWQFRKNASNKLEFIPFNASSNGAVTGATSINDGVIHTVIGTWDGTTIKVYVDEIFDGQSAFSGSLRVATNDVFLGKAETADPGWWDGYIGNGFIANRAWTDSECKNYGINPWWIYRPRTQRIFIPVGGVLSLSSAATLRDSDKAIATQQKAVSVDALIRAADLLIGTQQKSLSVDALMADADKLSTASRHEATLAAQLLDGDVSIAPAQKAGSISGLLRDSDRAIGISSKAALVTGLMLDGDLLTALGSQIETHQSAGVLSGADVLIAGVTTNRTVAGKAQDSDALTVASAISRLSAALGIEPESLTSAATSARSIGALIVEGDAAIAGMQSGRLQPALLIDGDILIITSSTIAQADLAGRINLSGRYAPQVSLVGVYAPAINLKGRVH